MSNQVPNYSRRIGVPRRHLTFGEDSNEGPQALGQAVEVLLNTSPSSDSLVPAFIPQAQPARSTQRSQRTRRPRPRRPPSLELRCAAAAAEGSESDGAPSTRTTTTTAAGSETTRARSRSDSVGTDQEKGWPSGSSASSDVGETWVSPGSAKGWQGYVPRTPPPATTTKKPRRQQQQASTGAKVNTAPSTFRVLLGTAARRDLVVIGLPAALCALGSGLAPPALTRILQEAFDAYATFNPTRLPIGLIDDAAKDALRRTIVRVVWQLAALGLLSLVLDLAAVSAWTALGERTAARARRKCYVAVSEKEMAWFDRGMVGQRGPGGGGSGGGGDARSSAEVGEGAAGLATRFSRDIDDIRTAYSNAMMGLLRSLATTVTALILAFVHSWKLALVTLAALPVAVMLTAICERLSGPLVQAERTSLALASRAIHQAVSSILSVKAFNGQQAERGRIGAALQQSSAAWNRTSLVWSLRAGLTSSCMLAMFVQGFWYGSHLVQTGQATAGLVMTVFWSCLLVTISIEQALRVLQPLQKGKAAAANVRTLCTAQPSNGVSRSSKDSGWDTRSIWSRLSPKRSLSSSASPPTTTMPIDAIPQKMSPASPVKSYASPDHSGLTKSPRSPRRSKSGRVTAMRKVRPARDCVGEVSFRSVSFAYPTRPGILALDHADFFFPSGETTFIIGSSGSGKSTVASLLAQLHRPSQGEIFIDNHSLGFLDVHWCLENILVLSQSPVLFDMSIHDNIAIGRAARAKVSGQVDPRTGIPIVAREEIILASRSALLHEFVISLPEGYDTVLGDKGLNLSGGQKQRLAIARARLCDPAILVLDEATSALDHASRLLVHEAVRVWRARSTTIIITHDLGQVGPDDYTYVMEHGRVVENGYRRHLEGKRHGALRAMLKAQARELPTVSISVPTSVIDEVPTSPTGLEACAVESLHGLLQEEPPIAFPIRSRPSSVAMEWAPRSDSRSTVAAWDVHPPSAASTTTGFSSARSSLAVEVEWLNKTGRAAAVGRQHQRQAVGIRRQLSTDANSQREASPSVQPAHPSMAEAGMWRLSRRAWTRQPRKMMTALGLLASVASGATMPVFSYFLAKLLSTMATRESNSHIVRIALLTLLIALLDGLCIFLRQFVMEVVAESWVRRLREDAAERVLRQDMAWFTMPANRAERIAHTLVRDGEDARNLVGQIWGLVLAVVSMIVVACVWALLVGWQLTLVGLGFVPLFGIVVLVQSHVLARLEAESKARRDATTKRFFDMTANIRSIRSMALDQVFLCRFLETDEAALRSGVRTGPAAGLGLGLGEAMTYLAEGVLFYVGAVLIIQGRYDFQQMVIVFNLMVFAVTYSSQMLVSLPAVSKACQAAAGIERLADLPVGREEAQGNARAHLDGSIEFDKVTFRYAGSPYPVLKELSFKIRPGETVAIVGASGCGKSTVLSLLQRFYEPSEGAVKVSGISVGQLDVGWLREHLSVVPQNPALFNMSLEDNIAYGDNSFPTPQAHAGVTTAEQDRRRRVENAAAWAQMDDTIRRFPEGYETMLGDDGAQLSGGQAQRVGIARALMRRYARIVLLDEFTSSLDQTRQADLVDLLVLRRARAAAAAAAASRSPIRPANAGKSIFPSRWFEERGVSVVVVTHNLEVMRRCDRILVMAGGRVVEDGSFERLLEAEGTFATLVRAGEWTAPPGSP